ncbi:class I SAM-dependent methyltransferase [Caballeronia sp. BR00000012568055]|uniref:class I SAM-dependent methyltransferase n=1 Tax=Caballeronia sp. BR00000012568055 TaxID=2918761 RepID=UPI0023F86204|nr:class I SAM-dependent methyltransferase [Caballeronia sp. BR00000012568055]
MADLAKRWGVDQFTNGMIGTTQRIGSIKRRVSACALLASANPGNSLTWGDFGAPIKSPLHRLLMMTILSRLMTVNSSRSRLFEENQRFANMIPAGAMVLDAGAGDAPYKSLVSHAVYESADFEKVDKPYAKSTYVCDLADIPVEANRYDFVLFNQVMEHLPEPKAVLKELFRVLKPGGKIIYTAPLFYEEHEQPYDFYRYTQFAIKYLFTEAGFTLERLDWLEGYYGTVAYQMNGMATHLPSTPAEITPGLLGVALAPLMYLLRFQMGLLSVFFHRLEMRSKFMKRGYPKNYVAVFSKPAQT